MTDPVVMTRECREAQLRGRGVSGKAMECLLAETAEERHLSRVAYARWAAEEYYLSAAGLDRDEVTHDTLTLMSGAILWADVIGVGGRDGVEGAATTRHPAFVSCGKGRKQANDGGAWSAAIHRAALGSGGCFRINSNGVLVYSLSHRDAPANETMVYEAIMPVAWVCSILREGLRRAAGLRRPAYPWIDDPMTVTVLGWHPSVPFDAAPESLAAWAKAYNEMVSSEQGAGDC